MISKFDLTSSGAVRLLRYFAEAARCWTCQGKLPVFLFCKLASELVFWVWELLADAMPQVDSIGEVPDFELCVDSFLLTSVCIVLYCMQRESEETCSGRPSV